MRQLMPSQKGFAAESMGQAYAHLQVAEALADADEYGGSMARAYYAALFAAKAALAGSPFKKAQVLDWRI